MWDAWDLMEREPNENELALLGGVSRFTEAGDTAFGHVRSILRGRGESGSAARSERAESSGRAAARGSYGIAWRVLARKKEVEVSNPGDGR